MRFSEPSVYCAAWWKERGGRPGPHLGYTLLVEAGGNGRVREVTRDG